MMSSSLRLHKIMTDRKLSFRDLANECGMSYTYLANVANGKQSPSLDVLEKIAKGLGLHVRDLFEQPSIQEMMCPKCGETLYIITKKEYDRLNKK